MRLLDANVVIDALDSNSPWHGWAVQVLVEEAIAADGAAPNPVALSEVLVACEDREAAVGEITGWGVELGALPPAVAIRASEVLAFTWCGADLRVFRGIPGFRCRTS